MDAILLTKKIDEIIQTAGNLLPGYLENPADRNLNDGNVSMCIVDENGCSRF